MKNSDTNSSRTPLKNNFDSQKFLENNRFNLSSFPTLSSVNRSDKTDESNNNSQWSFVGEFSSDIDKISNIVPVSKQEFAMAISKQSSDNRNPFDYILVFNGVTNQWRRSIKLDSSIITKPTKFKAPSIKIFYDQVQEMLYVCCKDIFAECICIRVGLCTNTQFICNELAEYFQRNQMLFRGDSVFVSGDVASYFHFIYFGFDRENIHSTIKCVKAENNLNFEQLVDVGDALFNNIRFLTHLKHRKVLLAFAVGDEEDYALISSYSLYTFDLDAYQNADKAWKFPKWKRIGNKADFLRLQSDACVTTDENFLITTGPSSPRVSNLDASTIWVFDLNQLQWHSTSIVLPTKIDIGEHFNLMATEMSDETKMMLLIGFLKRFPVNFLIPDDIMGVIKSMIAFQDLHLIVFNKESKSIKHWTIQVNNVLEMQL